MSVNGALRVAIACSLVACATNAPKLPHCARLEELQALPARQTCDETVYGEFEEQLAEVIVGDAGALLVRVEFDTEARVESACAKRASLPGDWVRRQALADLVERARQLGPGPRCLAGRRLDFNRYEAKRHEIEYAQRRCSDQVRRGMSVNQHGFFRQFQNCMQSVADWIVLDAWGSTRPVIFARPEVPEEETPRAVETANRCQRITETPESRIACIESDGWERLR